MTDPIVLVVGSLHYDIMVEADHLPRKDETAVGSRWYPKFGGKGGNQAVCCAPRRAQVADAGCGGREMISAASCATACRRRGVDHRFVAECRTGRG